MKKSELKKIIKECILEEEKKVVEEAKVKTLRDFEKEDKAHAKRILNKMNKVEKLWGQLMDVGDELADLADDAGLNMKDITKFRKAMDQMDTAVEWILSL